MSDILLATLNSSYQHTAFGLRYIYANMGALQAQTQIHEFTIAQNPRDIAETILKKSPKILGLGVYIWNCQQSFEVVSILKKIAPQIKIVLGGPEVSHESQQQAINQLADYVVQGEADFEFRELCQKILSDTAPEQKWLAAKLPEIQQIQLPYSFYSDEDIKNRLVYVEALTRLSL